MEALTEWVSIQRELCVILGYPLSLIEAIGILTSIASVYWATRVNRLTWSSGLVSEAALFLVFYQVQLYSDMLLQLFFAMLTLYGWYQWREDTVRKVVIRTLSRSETYCCLASVALGTWMLGALMSHLHILVPNLFPHLAASPYVDAFTTAASVVATVLLAQRAIESWVLWITVDLVSIPLYLTRGIPFMALLYLVFLGMASSGLQSWLERRERETRICIR